MNNGDVEAITTQIFNEVLKRGSVINIDIKCNRCGNKMICNFGESISGYSLKWYASYICDNCKNSMEVDGDNRLPDEFRDIVLREEGLYGLKVDFGGKDLVKVLSILRRYENLSFDTIMEIKKLAPGIIYNGTRKEIRRIQIILKDNLMNVEIEKLN